MQRNSFGRKVAICGLVGALSLGGCVSVGKGARMAGGGMRVAGDLAGNAALSTAGRSLGAAGNLITLFSMADQTRRLRDNLRVKGITFDNNVYVGSRDDFRIDGNDYLVVDEDMQFDAFKKNRVRYSDDFVVAVDTRNYLGKELVLTLSMETGRKVRSTVFRGSKMKEFRNIRQDTFRVGDNEHYIFWQPFEEGDNLKKKYSVMCVTKGNERENLVGVFYFDFTGEPNVYLASD